MGEKRHIPEQWLSCPSPSSTTLIGISLDFQQQAKTLILGDPTSFALLAARYYPDQDELPVLLKARSLTKQLPSVLPLRWPSICFPLLSQFELEVEYWDGPSDIARGVSSWLHQIVRQVPYPLWVWYSCGYFFDAISDLYVLIEEQLPSLIKKHLQNHLDQCDSYAKAQSVADDLASWVIAAALSDLRGGATDVPQPSCPLSVDDLRGAIRKVDMSIEEKLRDLEMSERMYEVTYRQQVWVGREWRIPTGNTFWHSYVNDGIQSTCNHFTKHDKLLFESLKLFDILYMTGSYQEIGWAWNTRVNEGESLLTSVPEVLPFMQRLALVRDSTRTRPGRVIYKNGQMLLKSGNEHSAQAICQSIVNAGLLEQMEAELQELQSGSYKLDCSRFPVKTSYVPFLFPLGRLLDRPEAARLISMAIWKPPEVFQGPLKIAKPENQRWHQWLAKCWTPRKGA